jgi:hypothetical protein
MRKLADELDQEPTRGQARTHDRNPFVGAAPALPDHVSPQTALGRRSVAHAHQYERQLEKSADRRLLLDTNFQAEQAVARANGTHQQPELVGFRNSSVSSLALTRNAAESADPEAAGPQLLRDER